MSDDKAIVHNLNKTLGFGWWKKYVTSAFWSNISTPLNLSITLLSALTTAQASTNNLLPANAFIAITISSLILSVVNTFFRPHTQLNESTKELQKWSYFGGEFEKILYSSVTKEEKIQQFRNLQTRVNEYNYTQNQNYFTDLLHIVVDGTCLKSRNKWMDFYDVNIDQLIDCTSNLQQETETTEQN